MSSNTTFKKLAGGCCGGCGTIFTLLAIGIAVRWSEGITMPNLVVPPKTNIPSPNAFDTYIGATQLLVNTKQIDDAVLSKPKVSHTVEQKAALVASNAAALAMLRTGFSQEYLDTSPRSISAMYSYFAQDRKLARLLQLDETVRAQKGDWSGAVSSGLDAITMGEDIAHSAPLIGRLVGIACEAIGRKLLWNYIDHLDSRQSHSAVKRLETIRSRHSPYVDTVLEEKYMSTSSLNLLFKDSASMQSMLGTSAKVPNIVYDLMYIRYSKESIARSNQQYFDAQIANAAKPYAMHLPSPPIPTDPINQVVLFDFGEAREKDVGSETQNALLALAIALHAYHLERGSYPQALGDLIPAYLANVPDDPYALQGTFHYRPGGGKYLLYSVGPDGVDDGGHPIDDPSKATATNKNLRYYAYSDSKGDIVAGVKW